VPDLITVRELSAALSADVRPVVLDVRWSLAGGAAREDYRAGHLPGAVFVDMDAELAGPPGRGGRHPLPDPAALQAAVRRWGVDPDRLVVCYDDGGTLSAARAWWVLRWAGLPDVRVLDGGITAWRAESGPLVTDEPEPRPGTAVVRPGGMPVLDADGAAKRAQDGVLLDVRAAERFRGEVEPMDPVAGHIPGARNAPITQTIDAAGKLLPADELAAYFARHGAAPGAPVAAYCGSGVTAAQAVLALRVAGVPAELYVGSWSDWCSDPERPVATGD
jgi:thiosulfate/3-mercaptopyruvate sulfurtransferase